MTDTPARWRSRRWLLPRVAVTVGLLAAGAAAGHFIGPPTLTMPAVASAPSATPAPSAGTTAGAGTVMPDVLALDEQTARRVLADAGVTAQLRTATRPAAGEAGRVVAQSPASGEAASGVVTLTLATAAATPKLTGATLEAARATLEKLGAVVTVTRVVRPSATAGTVASTTPKAGQPLTAVVTVAVNDPGRGLDLASLDDIDSDKCDTVDSASVNGTQVKASIRCYADRDGGATDSWNLARKVAMLTATVGLDDTGNTGTARVRLIGDGKVLADKSVRFGATTKLRVDVSKVLRLKVTVTTSSTDSVTVILGDATLLASEANLTALTGTS